MNRLLPLTPDHLFRILDHAGFKLDRSKGSHHIFIHPDSGRRVVVPAHLGREIPKGTLIEILRQAGITREDIEIYFG